MSRGGDTRFHKGQSGNPRGRPRRAQPAASAFDIIIDQVLTITQHGVERALTVDEALQLQTFQAALKGQRLAVRAVLRMIEKREKALAKLNPPPVRPSPIAIEFEADNAEFAMGLLGISDYDTRIEPGNDHPPTGLQTWATQAALSRRGRRRFTAGEVRQIENATVEPKRLSWPRSTRE